MSKPRGRPRRPPRTDPGEIQRSQDEKMAQARDRAVSMYPPERSTPPVPKIGLTAEDLEILAGDDTCPNAMVAKALPQRPAWIEEAFIASVAAVKEKFGPAPRGAPVACRLLTPTAAKIMMERSDVGIRTLHEYAAWVFRRVASTPFPVPSEYADIFTRIVIPTYNAINFASRRCLDCGKVFALRAPKEIEASRHCSEECDRRASKRGKERAGKGRSAVENAARKFGEQYQRHVRTCPICATGKQCPKAEALLTMSMHDALDRYRSNRDIEGCGDDQDDDLDLSE